MLAPAKEARAASGGILQIRFENRSPALGRYNVSLMLRGLFLGRTKADMRTSKTIIGVSILASALAGCVTHMPTRADMGIILQEQVQRCFQIPPDARDDPSVIVEVHLNTDGSLTDAPKIVSGPADSPIGKAAIRALNRCAPFAIPGSVAARLSHGMLVRISFDGG